MPDTKETLETDLEAAESAYSAPPTRHIPFPPPPTKSPYTASHDPLPLENPLETSQTLPPQYQVPDIFDLVRRGSHHTQLRSGVLHIVESATGHSLAITTMTAGKDAKYVRKENPDGTHTWYLEELQALEPRLERAYYSPLVVDEICRRLVEGESITKICTGDNLMPTYNEFCRWRRAHPWINEALDRAREDRAEKLRDEALDMADAATTVKDAAAQALKVETRKWAASIDSAKYNPKTKVEATVNMPTQIVVMTGIERDVSPQNSLPEAPRPPTLGSGAE